MNTVKITDNSKVKEFLSKLNLLGYNQAINEEQCNAISTSGLPNWLDDCLRGATGQTPKTSTRRISKKQILFYLTSLTEISTTTVAELLNRKRIAITGEAYSKSMIEWYTRAIRCASQAISHYLFNRLDIYLAIMGKSLSTKRPKHKANLTCKQRCKIRKLALNPSKASELNKYVKKCHKKNKKKLSNQTT